MTNTKPLGNTSPLRAVMGTSENEERSDFVRRSGNVSVT